MRHIHVTLIGRLAEAPFFNQLRSGTPCASFVLDVRESAPDGHEGANERYVCAAYGDLADALRSVQVGQRLVVTGELRTRHRQTEHGDRSLRSLVAFDVGVSVMTGREVA